MSQEEVLNYLKTHKRWYSAADISKDFEISLTSIGRNLMKLKRDPYIEFKVVLNPRWTFLYRYKAKSEDKA